MVNRVILNETSYFGNGSRVKLIECEDLVRTIKELKKHWRVFVLRILCRKKNICICYNITMKKAALLLRNMQGRSERGFTVKMFISEA